MWSGGLCINGIYVGCGKPGSMGGPTQYPDGVCEFGDVKSVCKGNLLTTDQGIGICEGHQLTACEGGEVTKTNCAKDLKTCGLGVVDCGIPNIPNCTKKLNTCIEPDEPICFPDCEGKKDGDGDGCGGICDIKPVCTPGEVICDKNLKKTCDVDGFWTTEDCTEDNELCDYSQNKKVYKCTKAPCVIECGALVKEGEPDGCNGVCGPPSCFTDATKCSDKDLVMVCMQGYWLPLWECPIKGGKCVTINSQAQCTSF